MDIQIINDMQEEINRNGLKSNKNINTNLRKFENTNYGDMLIDLEECLSLDRTNKKSPHITLVFFLYIISKHTYDIDNIYKNIKGIIKEKYYKFLCSGVKILIAGNSKTLKYKIELDSESWENKFEFIANLELRSNLFYNNIILIQLLKLIYKINRKDFYNLISLEESKFIFIMFFSKNTIDIKHSEEILLQYLNSNDQLVANSALNCLITRQNEYHLVDIVKNMDRRNCVALGVNLVLFRLNQPITSYFIDVMNANYDYLESELTKRQTDTFIDLNSLLLVLINNPNSKYFIEEFIMIRIKKIIKDYGNKDIEKFDNILIMLKNEYLIDVYNFVKECLSKIIVTEFDRQIRHSEFFDKKLEREKLQKYLNVIENRL